MQTFFTNPQNAEEIKNRLIQLTERHKAALTTKDIVELLEVVTEYENIQAWYEKNRPESVELEVLKTNISVLQKLIETLKAKGAQK